MEENNIKTFYYYKQYLQSFLGIVLTLSNYTVMESIFFYSLLNLTVLGVFEDKSFDRFSGVRKSSWKSNLISSCCSNLI